MILRFFPDLEVVWEFGPAGVAWVHGDEDATGRVEGYFCAFEQEHLQLSGNGTLDALNLLCYHRQHLQPHKLVTAFCKRGIL